MRAVISENLLLGEGLKCHKKSRLSARRGEDRSATGGCSVGGGLVIIIISLRRGVKKISFKFTKSSDYQRGVGIGAQLGAVRSVEPEEWEQPRGVASRPTTGLQQATLCTYK